MGQLSTNGCGESEEAILADNETERIDGSDDEDPFGHTKLLTLHNQACV